MAAVKVYVDLMSQPARALMMFLKVNNIPHEKILVSIAKGEHKLDAHKKIHKLGQLPAIDDGGFKVIESVAILRYLSRKYNVPDHWYPKDIQGQARVDEFLEWQHSGLRVPLASYFFSKFLMPLRTGQEASPEILAMWLSRTEESLKTMESVWLKDSPYVVGDKISVADLLALCEVEQTYLADYDPLKGRNILASWVNRVRKDLSPHNEDVHVVINKVLEKRNKPKL